MKTGNRLGALLLAMVMVFGLLPAAALAAADEAVMAETPLGEEAAEAALAEVPEAAEEPSAAAELAAGDITVTVAEDDITLIAANNVSWSAVEGATSYTVTLTSPTHTDVQSTGAASSVWYQDDTARTVKLVNLYPGTQYTVTVTGGGKSGSATFTTKSVTNSVAEELKNDPEAPRPYGALPDDQQLYYHDRDMAAFIHFGPNTYSGRSWGTGWETPATFALQAGELTENDPYYASHGGQIPKFVDQWIKELQDAGFERLVMVGKHHDGFCLWDSAVTEHNVTNSPYGRDLLADVSAACSKYGMDMGFYLSPWDQNATSFGYWTEADRTQRTTAHLLDRTRKDEDVSGDYNEFYIQQLREVLGNKKYGRDGVFVETWMDGAKGKFFQYQEGSTVGTNTNRDVDQEYDFDAYFKVIRELQPQCLIYTDRADGGIRWSGNEVGSTGANPAGTGSGDMCWQTMDIATFNYEGTDTPGMLKPWKANKWPRQLGQENGHIWSVCECDVSIETEWFWHSGNGTRSLDSLVDMYLTSVGYGSPFLLNVPPSQDGTFRDGTSVRLAELGKAIQDTFRTDLAAGKSVTASATRAAADSTKFAPGNLTDGDGDNFWAMNDDQTTGWVEVDLGSLQVFDVVSIQEFIALGQRIKAGMVEYRDAEGQWKDFGTFTTVGAKRIIRSAPVQGDRIRVKITASNATPVLRSVGVYKARSGMEVKNTIPEGMTYMDDRDSGFTYVGSWAEVGNEGYSDTRKGGNGENNSVSGSFTGSMFYLMGITDTAHGKVKIEIDAGTEHAITETVNTYSASRKAKAILYTSPPLSDGPHTVKFSRVDGWFEFDGIFYLPLGSSLVEFEKAAYQTFPDSDLELKIVRSGDASRAIQLQINDLPGTAVQGQHYAPVQETVTMAAGERELTITFHTYNGSPGNLAAGKDYSASIMGCSDGNTTLGVNATATITIVDPDTVPQEPKGETYTADDPFQFPTVTGKSRKLEGEYMVLDGTEATPSTSYVRVSTDANASNGKKLGWFEPGNKVILYYNAPRAGVYTVTLRYQSGRPTDGSNDNKVNWRGQNVEDFSGTIPGLGGNGSNYGEHSYQLTVTEAGEGSMEFYADASACPNIDWITFRLDTPAVIDTAALEAAITAAGEAKEGVETIDGKTAAEVDKDVRFVTAAEMKALTDAIAAAEEARDAEDKTDDSVAQALTALNDAVEAFTDAIKTGTKTSSSNSSSRPSTSTSTETKEDGTKVTTVTKPDGTVTETTESPDGAKAVVETKPDGSKTQTVEQPDGTKSELAATKDGDVTITVTDENGEEMVKTEIPAAIPEPETKFEDVDATPWAEEAIHKIAGLELVNGTGGNKYDPVAPMTRGSLATVLHRLSQGKTDYESTFKDVAEGKYYTEGVAWAAKAKVVTGYTAEIFAPDDIITREQLAVMLARYAKLIGMDTKADSKALDQFADGENTGSWAADGVAWCVENGILKGKGQNDLDPTANVTRAEVAVMLDRFIALLK